MDPLYEEEILAEETKVMFNPITFVFQFLASYGWYLLAGSAVSMYVLHRLKPTIQKWRDDREAAEYHKDPDKALARMEAIQRAREKQQQELLAASERAKELQKEREEQKRLENIERLERYGKSGGQRLGSEEDYLPLSGGASTSSYRAPKRSACKGGGCGR